ncbi:hypothetical protein J1C56_29305 [Aminobacter anthyllidis]|uniref:Uncharacterized protein n=1 Tax=Aminobacter anthyllidis TaxID=1035067 RepID=A0A9X1AHA3_9HYPH|nr:hypothetical protein [Aminobacter anthyllidis]MBT1159652.1 hypothetical protein [Aminobacter anthyllidis]
MFRTDLRALLEETGRYVVPDGVFNLYKRDRSDLTDVDAAIVDRESGQLCLVQLKWPDIYGRSLAERESRRTNLAKANEWVERVYGWVDGRTSAQVCKALQLPYGGEQPVSLMVLSRHIADFVRPTEFERRAIWTSWPRLAKTVSETCGADLLEGIGPKRKTTKNSV